MGVTCEQHVGDLWVGGQVVCEVGNGTALELHVFLPHELRPAEAVGTYTSHTCTMSPQQKGHQWAQQVRPTRDEQGVKQERESVLQ